jgi:acetaldehyde dehydrogenase (acetylating)
MNANTNKNSSFDLIIKLSRINFINKLVFVGRRFDSDGINIAKNKGIFISDNGIKYFIDNPTSSLTNLYIEQHIIVDYYNNNKALLEDVIRLIHLKMTSPNNSAKEEIYALLEKNKANINYYENKHHITNY